MSGPSSSGSSSGSSSIQTKGGRGPPVPKQKRVEKEGLTIAENDQPHHLKYKRVFQGPLFNRVNQEPQTIVTRGIGNGVTARAGHIPVDLPETIYKSKLNSQLSTFLNPKVHSLMKNVASTQKNAWLSSFPSWCADDTILFKSIGMVMAFDFLNCLITSMNLTESKNQERFNNYFKDLLDNSHAAFSSVQKICNERTNDSLAVALKAFSRDDSNKVSELHETKISLSDTHEFAAMEYYLKARGVTEGNVHTIISYFTYTMICIVIDSSNYKSYHEQILYTFQEFMKECESDFLKAIQICQNHILTFETTPPPTLKSKGWLQPMYSLPTPRKDVQYMPAKAHVYL